MRARAVLRGRHVRHAMHTEGGVQGRRQAYKHLRQEECNVMRSMAVDLAHDARHDIQRRQPNELCGEVPTM
jgi:hypothetical protein